MANLTAGSVLEWSDGSVWRLKYLSRAFLSQSRDLSSFSFFLEQKVRSNRYL